MRAAYSGNARANVTRESDVMPKQLRIDEYQEETEMRTVQLDEQANRQAEWTERASVDTVRDLVRKHLGG